ncbi:hypothetical protein P4475_13490 [Halalkalibacterium halodurans]|nr:hypothetical protein [Halalkalibacterium halodurans]MDY7221158.1 hypothetical protein [Halalkalibacterium halodurans]MDY7240397.1 hypothetical protein [Halalkalibacterium halodurans]MED3647797.1 hypothetical protein [Halalkalibacterium halodurans]MED4125363.1 hypothetical protein [Halalkalibacterium halodurans]MED4172499.1 hypothetical protein [Halalkalibacterium halodurans]
MKNVLLTLIAVSFAFSFVPPEELPNSYGSGGGFTASERNNTGGT